MLLLGRDMDSRFVFFFFFFSLTCQEKQCLGLVSAHVWRVLGSVWEPPVLQLPAPTPDIKLGTSAPGTGVALLGILRLLQMPEQRTNHSWLCFCALPCRAQQLLPASASPGCKGCPTLAGLGRGSVGAVLVISRSISISWLSAILAIPLFQEEEDECAATGLCQAAPRVPALHHQPLPMEQK